MKATLLYRIASVLLLVFAAGHTFGFLHFKPSTSAGRVVLDAMNDVHFQIGSGSFSYGGFYTGFGLLVTVYLLFSAFLAWHLGGLAGHEPRAIGALGWVFFLVQAATLVLSWIYFSVPPVVLSALVAVCVGWAAWLVQRAAA
jgi:hypothetical protein